MERRMTPTQTTELKVVLDLVTEFGYRDTPASRALTTFLDDHGYRSPLNRPISADGLENHLLEARLRGVGAQSLDIEVQIEAVKKELSKQ